ncbi:hypothetical protein SDC9_111117 [bioreactor metagenome]|uniref:Uncharacterized protein n=1 Tax=bioreactor metagenome TaxID=1076179 RepID=A0A645BI44_9ZZZZ
MGVEALLLRKVALGNGAEHLLGGLCGGQALRIRRVLGLDKPHPAGAAGGEHGPAVLSPVGKPLQKLAALLHDGEVGCKIGVEDVVKAHPAQRRHHPPGSGKLGGEAERLRPRHPHGGGHLNHRRNLRVSQSPQDLVAVVPDGEGGGGAVGDALAAEGAVRVFEKPVEAHVHRGAGAGARHVPDVHSLHLVADLHAAHALDALAGLPHHRGVQIHPGFLRLEPVGLKVNVQIVGQGLQGAVSAADAGGAGGVVLRENQAQVGSPGGADPGAVGADDHALLHLRVAGGDEPLGPLQLHHADAAGGDFVDFLQIAQVGNGNARLLSGA